MNNGKKTFPKWKMSKQNFQCLHTQKLWLHRICLSAHRKKRGGGINSLCNERVDIRIQAKRHTLTYRHKSC